MCGIVGILAHRRQRSPQDIINDVLVAEKAIEELRKTLKEERQFNDEVIEQTKENFTALRTFQSIFQAPCNTRVKEKLDELEKSVNHALSKVETELADKVSLNRQEELNKIKVVLLDCQWQLQEDIGEAIRDLQTLNGGPWTIEQEERIHHLWQIDCCLRNVGRIEIRGRDSAGISVMISFRERESYDQFIEELQDTGLWDTLERRKSSQDFSAFSVIGGEFPGFIFSYKVAKEIGRMGENVSKLRRDIRQDRLLASLLDRGDLDFNVLAHTRWASNGVISEPNAHPQDCRSAGEAAESGRICAVLNGDIDNYQILLEQYKKRTGREVSSSITTDAKIIPLLIGERYRESGNFLEAFRETVRDFEGSFAIAVHQLDCPEKFYLAIKGSGQSLYVGLAQDSIVVASELYGVVECTPRFIKMDGEWGANEDNAGQVLVVSQDALASQDYRAELVSQAGASQDYRAALVSQAGASHDLQRPLGEHETMKDEEAPLVGYGFDGTPLPNEALKIRKAEITTRDICLGGWSHYFLKEVNESVSSVEKTIQGRFLLPGRDSEPATLLLDESVVPSRVIRRLKEGRIKKIFCIGQGTAGVAAAGVAVALDRYLSGLDIDIEAQRASELSGHQLSERMDDTLLFAVSQSGTTADTNRTVDLVRARGAHCISIVNRRNSDLVYKSDGVLYTSDGRDIEMSVASTKAFYSQVTAGYLLALHLADKTGVIGQVVLRRSLEALKRLPKALERTMERRDAIAEVARRHSLNNMHWACVGSGPNYVAAQEIRIKLSELCYKSIACDYLEDKKHIDLSSEPMILMCATGLDSVMLSDAVKEAAIFKAHRSVPIVFASEGVEDFGSYAADVISCPLVGENLDFIPQVMAGHLFGFYAAEAIDDTALPLRSLRTTIVDALSKGEPLDFSECQKIERNLLLDGALSSALDAGRACRLLLALRYARGKLDREDFIKDFDGKNQEGHIQQNAINELTEAINQLTRPIDAIKHQAKTVTVGITREELRLSEPLSRVFKEMEISQGLVSRTHLEILRSITPLLSKVRGASHYLVEKLRKRGIPGEDTTCRRVGAWGEARDLVSRTSESTRLKGTKWLCIKEGTCFIGVGRKDQRPICIVPLSPSSKGNDKSSGLLLFHIEFKDEPECSLIVEALKKYNGQYDRLMAAATELDMEWKDSFLSKVPVIQVFDFSLDRVIEAIRSIRGKQRKPA